MEPDGVSRLLYFLATMPLGIFSIFMGYLLIHDTNGKIISIKQCQYHIIITYINYPKYIKHIIKNMLKSLSVPQSQLSIPQRLLQICKKSAITNDGKPEIDFLLLDREMEQLQQIQTKTCQQIVQFVDEHLEQFIDINRRFDLIQQNVQSTEMLIKKLIPKLDMYKASLFSPQSKIQQFMTHYQKKLMQQRLSQAAKQQTEFLLEFIHNFEVLININMEQLTHKHKYIIVRMLKKKQYIRSIFEHPLIKTVCHNSNDLSILLSNITEELEFYLSEQLSRVAIDRELRNTMKEENGLTALEEMQMWYQYIGKEQAFFDTVEESIIGRQLSALELTLLAHKQSLIVGNEEHILKQFFVDLFSLVQEFPIDYPMERILKIIYKFLAKKQLNFLYSYVVPTFPISYSAYKSALYKIQNKALRTELETRHGWNLKLWADLRIKTIMDRSGKDRDKSLLKWIDIVFKKSFMIYGVKNHMIKLAFMLVNRFCFKIEEQMEYNTKNFNENINVLNNISSLLRNKLLQCFDQELNGQNKDQIKQKIIREQINQVISNVHGSINASLKKWLKANLQTVINTCKSSHEPYKSLIASIVSKKDRQKISFNTQENILKPLRAYFKNNPDLSEASCKFAQDLTLQILQKYYDSQYAKQIYNHCDTNISKDQMKQVMEIVALERQTLFERQKVENQ